MSIKLNKKIISFTLVALVLFVIPIFANSALWTWDLGYYTKFFNMEPGSWDTYHQKYFETGDGYLPTADSLLNDKSLSPEEKQAYQKAKDNYLEKRHAAIKTGDEYNNYATKGVSEAGYANTQYALMKARQRGAGLEEQIKSIDDGLAQQGLSPEAKAQLGQQKKDLQSQQPGNQQSQDDAQAFAKKQAAEILADSDSCISGTIVPHMHVEVCLKQAFSWIGNFVTYVFGIIVWISASIFDLTIYISITSLHNWFNIPGIEYAWKVLRDLANICFIFLLLYIAFGTIIDYQGIAGKAQGMIVNIIIIALLVNFSGFFTRVVIDTSNVLAYEFYTKINGDEGTGVLSKAYNNIGTNLLGKLHLENYMTAPDKDNDPGKTAPKLDSPTVKQLSYLGIIFQTIMNIFIILVTSFVLIVASILFLIRTITLVFLYVFSPLAFVSRVIPGKFNYFDPWLSKLISQSFFAPGFLIPLYLVFSLLGTGGLASQVPAVSGTSYQGSMSLLLFDFIVLGMLAGCILIGNKVGAMGMAVAMKGAGKINSGLVKGGGWVAKKGVPTVAKQATKRIAAIDINGRTVGDRAAAQWARTSTRRVVSNVAARASAYKAHVAGIELAPGYTIGAATTDAATTAKEKFTKSEFGKGVIGAVKNPLLTGSDWVGSAAAAGGVAGVNILGNTSAERSEAKKKEKEQAEKDRIKKYNDDLTAQIRGITGTPLARYNALEPLLDGLHKNDLKIVDLKIFADDPIAAIALNLKNLQELGNRPDRPDDAPHKSKIKANIIDETNRNITGCHSLTNPLEMRRKIEYQYMTGGAGHSSY